MNKNKKAELTRIHKQFFDAGTGNKLSQPMAKFVDENVYGFGTAVDEKVSGLAEFKKLLNYQKKQSKGIDIQWKVKPLHRFISDDENNAVFSDELYLSVVAGGEHIRKCFRFSVVLNYINNHWKVIHWHGSAPELLESEKDTFGINEWKQKTIALENIVAERTSELVEKNRELEIEAALERVRTVAMGMSEQADMLAVCKIISEQLTALGAKEIRNVQTAIIYKNKGTYLNYEFYAKHNKALITEVSYQSHHMQKLFANRMLKGSGKLFTRRLNEKDVKEWYKYQKTTNQFADKFLEKANSLNYYWYSLGAVALGISTYEALKENEINLFKRFLKVFELAYKRFLDIEKAEAQAREAQIEAALERVRAVTLSMKDSSELGRVIFYLYSELTKLDAKLDRCFIMIVNSKTHDMTWWMSGKEGLLNENGFLVQNNDYSSHQLYIHYWKKRTKKWQYVFEGKEKRDWDKFGFSKTELINLPNAVKKDMASVKKTYLSGSSDSFGCILTGSLEPLSEEHQEIISKFTVVFNQTYTRFLDLQKAEAQAKEAEIQLALERVRAKTMAMHKSDDLADAAALLFQQVKLLGIETYTNGFNIWDEQNKTLVSWMSNPSGVINPPFIMPLNEYSQHKSFYKAWKRHEQFIQDDLTGSRIVAHYKYLRSFPLLEKSFATAEKSGIKTPERQVHNVVFFTNGYVLFVTLKPHPEYHDLFKRFGQVFQQTYTRFLDLQKAEAQAREAEIQLSLERVRAKSLAMHHTSELQQVIHTVHSELLHLRIAIYGGSFIAINSDVKTTLRCWGAGGTADTSEELELPPYKKPFLTNLIKGIKKGAGFFTEEFSQQDKKEFFKFLFKYEPWSKLNAKEKKETLESPGGYTRSCFVSKHTSIFIINHSGINFSAADNEILKRFGNVFEQSYTRFLDLQKAEAQVREAQIEAALERVRSRSLAMHKSEELADLSRELVKQVQALGVSTWFCAFNISDDSPEGSWEWGSNGEITFPKYRTPKERIFLKYQQAAQRGETLFINEIGKDECPTHYEYLCTLPGVGDQLLEMKAAGIPFPSSQIDHVAYFKYGYILFITYEPVPESYDVFKRFAKVFEQSYTRFLDLQKAEAQAREAQIEAALERVRSRSMAMHKSDELKEVIRLVLQQFVHLNIKAEHAGFYIDYKAHDDMHIWLADPNLEPFFATLPYFDTPTWNSFQNAKAKGTTFHTDLLDFKEKNKFYKALFKIFKVPEKAKEFYMKCKGLAVSTVLLDSVGLYIENFSAIPYTDEENNILMRFGKVFQQTYTRFLDLENAQSQAREAQIQLALERVRARTMAMQHSNELSETTAILFQQMNELGNNPERLNIGIINEDKKMVETWATEQGGHQINHSFNARLDEPTTVAKLYNGWKTKKTSMVVDLSGNELKQWIRFLKDELKMPVKEKILQNRRVQSVAYFKEGFILLTTSELPPVETISLLERFAQVFQQTYTRFLDLRKAEAQTREAQIQLALERVRARTMAMHSSTELAETADIMFEQVQQLGAELQGVAFAICDKESGMVQKWTSIGIFSHPSNIEPGEQRMYEAWKNQEGYYEEIYEGERQREYYEAFMEIPEFRQGIQKFIDSGFPIPTWQKNHAVTFKYGYLLFIATKPFTETDIFIRFGKVFEQTYTRFLDLKKAEAQALRAEEDLLEIKRARKKAEEALTELQATQKQLIQSEKMASLGELTAGIAHEIQNPLNFVNNFSEVSTELVDEMNEEISKGNLDDAKEIANDLKQNLEKINHHGKRAGEIVKGMLQHSRTSSGKKEATDINALCDEYLRLAYHGLRARDKNFNANIKTEFDDSLTKINVVPQDIGRMLLNLFNNAFYAVNEKKKLSANSYQPIASVTTKKSDNHVIITISDNGNGIPEKIQDKIFQPFFTTKPSGSGTGLGLSLSYDIVKVHGGEIKVSGKEGEGTEFKISLPLV